MRLFGYDDTVAYGCTYAYTVSIDDIVDGAGVVVVAGDWRCVGVYSDVYVLSERRLISTFIGCCIQNRIIGAWHPN